MIPTTLAEMEQLMVNVHQPLSSKEVAIRCTTRALIKLLASVESAEELKQLVKNLNSNN